MAAFPFRIEMKKGIRDELRRFPKPARRRFGLALQALQEDPFTSRPGCDVKVHKGIAQGDAYRLRVGEYRFGYVVDVVEKLVTIVRFGRGHDIYG